MKEEFDKELREVSPLLAYLKKEQEGDSFKVPKFYFDNLADKVIAQTKIAENTHAIATKQTPQYPTFWGRLQDFVSNLLSPRLALAFGSCLIVAVGVWFMLMPKKSTSNGGEPSVATTMPANDGQLANATELKGAKIVENATSTPKNGTKTDRNAEKLPNSIAKEVATMPQNAPKLTDTEGVNPLATNVPLTHPQSGLTEEELAQYLEENTEENDPDGSDNNL